MKKPLFPRLRKLSLTCLIVLTANGIANSQAASDGIADLMNHCNIQAITAKFSSDVELCIFETNEYIGKTDAVSAFTSFMKTHTCQGFKVRHQGVDPKKPGKEFLIGNLSTPDKEFRVTFFISYNQILEIDINNVKK